MRNISGMNGMGMWRASEFTLYGPFPTGDLARTFTKPSPVTFLNGL